MNVGINGGVNLDWDDYEGYQVSNYLIFRGDSTGIMTMINSISGSLTSYSDGSPPNGYLTYQVRALAQQCNVIPNGTPANDTLESNIIDHNNVPFTVSITSSNASCDTCSDGFAIANASGGTSPYSYVWSNGISGNFIGNLSAGTYIVFAFDVDNQQISDTVTIIGLTYGCTDPSALNYNSSANTDDVVVFIVLMGVQIL
jgi:hypothetical protein